MPKQIALRFSLAVLTANLHAAPRNAFDHARPFVALQIYHVADLKRLIGLQGDSGKKISQSILQRETDDDSQNRRTREQRRKLHIGKLSLKDDKKCDDAQNYR